VQMRMDQRPVFVHRHEGPSDQDYPARRNEQKGRAIGSANDPRRWAGSVQVGFVG